MAGLIPILAAILAVATLMPVQAVCQEVIVFGADCTPAQRQALFRVFGVQSIPERLADVTVLTVTNQEERAYLEGVPGSIIGTRAISSAYIVPATRGSGITVETYNITFVTPEMYASALVTAGVKDAKVIAAAPSAVSGTAALTGIIKAFEAATGRVLKNRAKLTAHEELITTSQLGQEMEDPDRAAAVVWKIKRQVIREGVSSPREMEQIVMDTARESGIELTAEQKQRLIRLMEKVNSLDLDVGQMSTQLDALQARMDEILNISEETRSLLGRIIGFLANLLSQLLGAIGHALERMAGR